MGSSELSQSVSERSLEKEPDSDYFVSATTDTPNSAKKDRPWFAQKLKQMEMKIDEQWGNKRRVTPNTPEKIERRITEREKTAQPKKNSYKNPYSEYKLRIKIIEDIINNEPSSKQPVTTYEELLSLGPYIEKLRNKADEESLGGAVPLQLAELQETLKRQLQQLTPVTKQQPANKRKSERLVSAVVEQLHTGIGTFTTGEDSIPELVENKSGLTVELDVILTKYPLLSGQKYNSTHNGFGDAGRITFRLDEESAKQLVTQETTVGEVKRALRRTNASLQNMTFTLITDKDGAPHQLTPEEVESSVIHWKDVTALKIGAVAVFAFSKLQFAQITTLKLMQQTGRYEELKGLDISKLDGQAIRELTSTPDGFTWQDAKDKIKPTPFSVKMTDFLDKEGYTGYARTDDSETK